jgi:hypothetical protein
MRLPSGEGAAGGRLPGDRGCSSDRRRESNRAARAVRRLFAWLPRIPREQAINDLQVLIDEKMTATGSGACWIDVNPLKSVAVRKEDGSDWLPAVRIGSAGTAVNSKCSIDAGG